MWPTDTALTRSLDHGSDGSSHVHSYHSPKESKLQLLEFRRTQYHPTAPMRALRLPAGMSVGDRTSGPAELDLEAKH